MTVPTSASSVTLACNGVTTVFPFAFTIPGANSTDQSNVVVTLVDESVTPATTTVLSTSAWSVTGISTPLVPSAGGAVTYPLTGSPGIAGQYLTIQRVVPQTQSVSLPNQGGYFPKTIEGAFDYVTFLVQQISAQVQRALQVSVADPGGIPTVLPPAATRANMALAFDSVGNPIAGALANIVINAAMIGLVQSASVAASRAFLESSVVGDALFTAASAAAARATLQLGTAATVDTGTAGAKIPLLNGANTYSALQTLSAGLSLNGGVTLASNATKAEMQSATAGRVVTPDIAAQSDSAAKAWVYFTVAAGVVTIRASFNVASVTRLATGSYRINFTTPFSSANYAAFASCAFTAGAGETSQEDASLRAAGTWGINSQRSGVGAFDSAAYSAIFYGQQ